MLLPDLAAFWFAVAGGVAGILGSRRLGFSLMIPAVMRWLVWPSAAPFVSNWAPGLSPGVILLLVLLTPPMGVAIAIRMQQRILDFFFGPRASADVTAVYVVRALDGFARGILLLLLLPFRLLVLLWRRIT